MLDPSLLGGETCEMMVAAHVVIYYLYVTFRAKPMTHIWKFNETTLKERRRVHKHKYPGKDNTLCILLPSNSISFQTEMLVCIQMIVAQLDER